MAVSNNSNQSNVRPNQYRISNLNNNVPLQPLHQQPTSTTQTIPASLSLEAFKTPTIASISNTNSNSNSNINSHNLSYTPNTDLYWTNLNVLRNNSNHYPIDKRLSSPNHNKYNSNNNQLTNRRMSVYINQGHALNRGTSMLDSRMKLEPGFMSSSKSQVSPSSGVSQTNDNKLRTTDGKNGNVSNLDNVNYNTNMDEENSSNNYAASNNAIHSSGNIPNIIFGTYTPLNHQLMDK